MKTFWHWLTASRKRILFVALAILLVLDAGRSLYARVGYASTPSARSSSSFCKRTFSRELYSAMFFLNYLPQHGRRGGDGGGEGVKIKSPASNAKRTRGNKARPFQPTLRIFTLYVPPGVSTFTVSPTL